MPNIRTQRNDEQRDEDEDDPLPAGTEHVVVIHGSMSVPAGVVLEHDAATAGDLGLSEADAEGAPGERRNVVYGPGDEVALPIARRVWGSRRATGFSDRLAALDGNGERLDTPARSEARGDIDADPALAEWRRRNGLRRVTKQVYVCEECGEEFESVKALNGHQSAHTDGETGRPPAGAETLADRVSGDETGETGETAADGGEGE